ncbi:propionyl-CoA synthetase [Methanocalculus chunghsingensis]|uniref:Propionyl-CoA synthetase n=1 Tax=Methanocalculus chunghsingensis TaxID=156457 RepID=A0A8J8B646_9EURY|nr:propionyl-CoA synthetase [Methanocalculus chunghsingensis]MBR1369714.1 propionyl-CoA synthetase [Methanocalculus chunghsingensis]
MGVGYEQTFHESITDPEKFWGAAAEKVRWYQRYDRVLNSDNPPMYRWFEGGVLNSCYNALDYHVEEGRGDQIALIYDSPVTDTITTFTYGELLDLVARCAGGLQNLGVQKGDRVIIYMPMIPEAVIAMLACARIGAVHSVVFGGFAARELATRIEDARPEIIITASCGIEVNRVIPYKPLLDAALALSSHTPSQCVFVQRQELPVDLMEGRDISWDHLMDAEPAPCVPVGSTDPLYILYTSGTTGKPKGVVRDNGGHLVALVWSMEHIYGVRPGEVYWAASDIGWVVGHSYIVYGPLFYGCTTILYEGKSVGTPDPGAFWRVIAEHDVSVLFCAPTAFRAIRREDPDGLYRKKYDLSSLKMLFLAGERCDPDTLLWAEELLGIPVIDHWWQTETGWAIGADCAGLELLPIKPGSCTRPVPGYDIHVLDDTGNELPRGEIGNIVISMPLPPGCFITLWNNDADYIRTYFTAYPGYYLTSDAGYLDEDGYLWIMGRTDDIINVAGHRLSTGAMEEVLASHPDVAECAVFGVYDPVKGEVPVGFVVLKSGHDPDAEKLQAELIALVRQKIGPIASFKSVAVVQRLPKTRSGKILRGTIKRIADGVSYTVPATIDDPAILDEITLVLQRIGYPKR